MPHTDSAREEARRRDGKFGEQQRAEDAGVDLMAAGPRGPEPTWHPVDADDRWPGQYQAHVAEQDGFRLRIDPGDNASYTAEGFSWAAENGSHRYSGTATTLEDARREAVEAVEYVTSGQAAYDASEW